MQGFLGTACSQIYPLYTKAPDESEARLLRQPWRILGRYCRAGSDPARPGKPGLSPDAKAERVRFSLHQKMPPESRNGKVTGIGPLGSGR